MGIMFRYSITCSTWLVPTSLTNIVRVLSTVSPSTNSFSNVPASEGMKKKQDENIQNSSKLKETKYTSVTKTVSKTVTGSKSPLVAAAFRSLSAKKPLNLIEKLQAVDKVDDLLSLTTSAQFTQYHGLQAMSILTTWTTEKKIKISDFESDPRFVNLCRMLGRKKDGSSDEISDYADVALVLGVSGGDQAAKLVSNVTFSQKLKVLSTLALKRRRTIPLLRALASNIGESSEKLNIKEASDVLYALSVLNYPDDVLLSKAASDINLCLSNNKKPAVVGSILTSIGILKYKNTDLLNVLTQWIEKNLPVCREVDLVSLLLTLASVNHSPQNHQILDVIVSLLSNAALKPNVWLDVVWSLVVLNETKPKHLMTVLDPHFIEKMLSSSSEHNLIPLKIKLLNIHAAAQHLCKNYSGPFLTDTSALTFPLQRSREKQLLVDSVLDSLSNLLPSSTYLNSHVDSGYGFLIDGVCAVDHKCNPLPVNDATSSLPSNGKRIAVYVCDYHDTCRGCKELTGPVVLHLKILKELGYRVMTVSYLDFQPTEKLIKRVKYLEKSLKKLATKDV